MIDKSLYYDIDGRPITHDEVRAMFEDDSRRRVGYDEGLFFRVSTVHLVIDHNFGFGGPPIIFETMAFPRYTWLGGMWGEQFCARYSTLAEARMGHAVAVRKFTGWHGALEAIRILLGRATGRGGG